MKNTLKLTALALAFVMIAVCFVSCKGDSEPNVWDAAVYAEDTEIGEGETTFTLKVEALDKTVVFTVSTNADTVGAALLENKLIEGDEGQYGLYIKKVNGILADYDVNQRYWAFYINGEYAMTGVDTTEINADDVYSLVYAQ